MAPEGGGAQSSALSVLEPVVLWVVATSSCCVKLWCGSCRHDGCAGSVVRGFLLADDISKNSMKLSAVRLRVEEKFGFGGGSPYLSSDETRCTVVVLRCGDGQVEA